MQIKSQRWTAFLLVGVFSMAALLVFPGTIFAASTYTVTITGTQFVPSTLKVSLGDTVKFLNNSTATQSAKSTVTTGGFNTGNIGPSQSKSVVMTTAGTWAYSSQYSSLLTGTIEVGSSSSSLTSSSSGSLTTQPTTTQSQPVSGAAEVLAMVLAAGVSFLFVGGFGQRWLLALDKKNQVVEVPPISLHHDNESV